MITSLRQRCALLATVAIVAGLALPVPTAPAQVAVVDAADVANTLLTAKRALDQINNQITQIQQFMQMLQNEALNLTSLPFSVVAEFDQTIARLNSLMGQAQGILYNVENVQSQYQRYYPTTIGAGTPSTQLAADAQTRWQYSLASFQHTMEVQSQIIQDMPADQAQLEALVAQSQGAVGALQSTQAGNQLIALHAKQLAALQALLATQARSQVLEQARKAEAEAQAAAQFQQFLGAAPGDYAAAPVQMFH